MIETGQSKIQHERETQKIILEAEVTAGIDDAAPMKLAILDNDISQGDYEGNVDVPIVMTDLEKTHSRNKWRTYREKNSQLKKYRGQGFSLILGQCTNCCKTK